MKESALGNKNLLMSTINPNTDKRPEVSLAESVGGFKEINDLNNNIKNPISPIKEGSPSRLRLPESPKMNKKDSMSSYLKSDERDIEETNELINEINCQIEDLGVTFDEISHKKHLQEMERHQHEEALELIKKKILEEKHKEINLKLKMEEEERIRALKKLEEEQKLKEEQLKVSILNFFRI
jgi:hypothetical protein